MRVFKTAELSIDLDSLEQAIFKTFKNPDRVDVQAVAEDVVMNWAQSTYDGADYEVSSLESVKAQPDFISFDLVDGVYFAR